MKRAALALLAVVCSSCADGLQFRGDHRLGITAPRDRQVVGVPFDVRWTMEGDYDGLFAVFVDRSPMPVGKTLRWVAGGDDGCKRDPRCPDEAYLRERNVYLTEGNSVTIPLLPKAVTGAADDRHEVTVVLLDRAGKRLSEVSWYRVFTSDGQPR